MSLDFTPEPVPLQTNPHGSVRATGTRVTLDTIVGTFNDGASAEEIVLRYPTLRLPEVYTILAYYLRHRAEVDAYLHDQQQEADAVRRENEIRFPPHGVRERLLARRTPARTAPS